MAKTPELPPGAYYPTPEQQAAHGDGVKPPPPPAPATPPELPAGAYKPTEDQQNEYAKFLTGRQDMDMAGYGGNDMTTHPRITAGNVMDWGGQLGAGVLDSPGAVPQMGVDIYNLLAASGQSGPTPSLPEIKGSPLKWWQKNVSGTDSTVSRFTGDRADHGIPYYVGQNLGAGEVLRLLTSGGARILGKEVPKFAAEKTVGDSLRNMGGDVLGTVAGAGAANAAANVTQNPYVVGGAGLLGGLVGGSAVPVGARVAGETLHYNQFSNRGRANTVGQEMNDALGGLPLGQRIQTVPGMRPTAAQAFDNQGLMSLQQATAARSHGAAGLLGNRMDENDQVIQAAVDRLGGTGDIADTIATAKDRLDTSNQTLQGEHNRFASGDEAHVASTKVRGNIDEAMNADRAQVDANYAKVGGKDIPVNGEQIADAVDEFTNKLDPTQQTFIKNWVSDNLRGSKNMDAVISVLKKLNSQFSGHGADGFIRGELAKTITNKLDEQLTHGEEWVNGFRKDPVEGGADALANWREAKKSFSDFMAKWHEQPDLKKVVATTVSGQPMMTPEASLGQLFSKGPEGAGKMRQLLDATRSPETIRAIRDYAYRSMMQRAREPSYARTWLNDHSAALSHPELAGVRRDLDNVVSAWESNKTISKDRLSAIAGLDPSAERNAIDALTGGRKAQNAPQLADQVLGLLSQPGVKNPDLAKAGIKKGLINVFLDQAMTTDGSLSAASVAKQFKEQHGLLSRFLTPAEMQELEVATQSARVNRLNKPKVRQGQSDTSATSRQIGGVVDELASHPAGATVAGGTAGYAAGGVPGMAIGATLGGLLHAPMKNSIAALDNARIRAHLDPDQAERLIKNAAKRAQWLKDHPVTGLLKSPSYWLSNLNASVAGAMDAKDAQKGKR